MRGEPEIINTVRGAVRINVSLEPKILRGWRQFKQIISVSGQGLGHGWLTMTVSHGGARD